MPRRSRKAPDHPADAIVTATFNAACNGIQISILDIPRIYAAGRQAHDAGQDVAAIVRMTVAHLRKN